MPTPEFKRGDVGDKLTAVVNMDLTGCTVKFLARLSSDPVAFELAHVVTDEPAGEVEHTLDGTLAVGTYVTEIEATRGAEIFTFPTSSQLPRFRIVQDLG